MSNIIVFLIVNVLCLIVITYGQHEGEACTKDNKPGVCKNLKDCQAALADIKNRQPPQICSFVNIDAIVCCLDPVTPDQTSPAPLTTTPKPTTTSTTEYIPPVEEYEDEEQNDVCAPIAANLTIGKTGRKAIDKCIEYQEMLVYPCERGADLNRKMSRGAYCYHSADELIVGGVDASYSEFPHMVLLGFGDTPESAQWACAGSLISEKFILTAGHCTSTRQYGDVRYARLSLLKRTDPIVSSKKRLYEIGKIIKHPEYKAPNKYNDIALLETTVTMTLDQFAVPACIHTGTGGWDGKAIATGWGAEKYRGSNANTMQKVTLTKFTTAECSEKFPPNIDRHMKLGFQESTQLCYGDKKKSKDTCQGDSGGPLQIKNKDIYCMYNIVGVTSFGRACGFIGEPGVYTRVEAYAEWIESIVWP